MLMIIGFTLLAFSSFLLGNINLQVRMERHLAERSQRRRHQFHFCAADDVDDGPFAPGTNGQRSGLYNLMRNLGGSFGIAFVDDDARARRAKRIRR